MDGAEKERIALLLSAVQLFSNTFTEDEVFQIRSEVFKSLGVELPKGGSNPTPQIELALD